MRILATVTLSGSHARALLMALRPLLDAGHEIHVAVPPSLARSLDGSGTTVHPVLTEMVGRPSSGRQDRHATPGASMAALAASPEMLAGARALIELAGRIHPDLVIRDDCELGAMLAAEELGLPHLCLPGGMANLVDPEVAITGLNRLWAELGHDRPLPASALYRNGRVDFVPEAFDFAAHPLGTVHRYRQPVLTRAGERLPSWIAELPGDVPFVYASLGTAMLWITQLAGDGPGLELTTDPVVTLAAIVDALAEMDCHALVSTGGLPVSREQVPAHVHLVEHTAQPLVLEAADLFITHGGYNGVREAMRSATPMVVFPTFGDHPHNGARVVELGLGLMSTEPSATTVRALSERVLGDPAFARRARAARANILALPDSTTLADDVELLSEQPTPTH